MKMSADLATVAAVSPVKIDVVDDADDDSSSGLMTFSDSDPKDSGVDCGDDPNNSELPDEETAESILKMVEFYLSDENILKDAFLLKHVRRNKEGYISVKLLASFRKVRSLCKGWKAVAYSLARSKALALNSDGTKVRRVDPLPDHDETASSRSVLAHGFAPDRPVTVDTVGELFARCGDIALVRILRPGGPVPGDVKRFLAKNPDVQSRVCALVEFEDHASARRALESELEGGARVIPVTLRSPKPAGGGSPKKENAAPEESPRKKKKNRRGSIPSEKKSEAEKAPASLSATDDPGKRTRRCSSGSTSSQSSGYLSSSPGGGGSGCFLDPRYPRRHSFNPSIYNDPNSAFASLNGRYSGSRERLQRTATEGSATLSPWRRRREQQLMQSDSNLASSRHSGASPLLQAKNPPVQTIRAPRGPDGTRGFLPRPRLPSTAE